MESPLLPNLITSRQLKQFCVFYFSAPLKQQHLDNFNYHFNSVKCTKVESLVTNDGSLPYCFSDFLTGGFALFSISARGSNNTFEAACAPRECGDKNPKGRPHEEAGLTDICL